MPKEYWLNLSPEKKYPYSIIRSSRAKYIRLKLSNEGLLTLVIPRSASINHGQSFIQSKIGWIEKQLKKVNAPSNELPRLLDLKFLKEKWNVVYIEEGITQLHLSEEDDFTLSIRGAVSNKVLVKKILNKWCQHKAKLVFNKMLSEIASQYGFQYRKLTIRSQKTRWGSCSHNKNINLNSKLLFLNENIVSYVMIHELCHTIEMNHSKHFWRLVQSYDPAYLLNQKELKDEGRKILL